MSDKDEETADAFGVVFGFELYPATKLPHGLYWAMPVGEQVRGMFEDRATVVEWTGTGFSALVNEREWEISDFRILAPAMIPPRLG